MHSCTQLEHYKNVVDDKSRVIGGKQQICTVDGYTIPLKVRKGLVNMDMRPPTDSELEELPHVVLTSDLPWDPTALDHDEESNDLWSDAAQEPPVDYDYGDNIFDEQGYFRHHTLAEHFYDAQDALDPDLAIERLNYHLYCEKHEVATKEPDYSAIGHATRNEEASTGHETDPE